MFFERIWVQTNQFEFQKEQIVELELSQAAACDGLLYQVMPENFQTNPAPGVLPL